MADRKNFLDREKEKRDGENYLPYSIALIPGLTALEQDALVKDVAEGLFKHAGIKNVEKGNDADISNYIDARRKADRLEQARRYLKRLNAAESEGLNSLRVYS